MRFISNRRAALALSHVIKNQLHPTAARTCYVTEELLHPLLMR